MTSFLPAAIALSAFMLLSSISAIAAGGQQRSPQPSPQAAPPASTQVCISLDIMTSQLKQKYNESIQRILKDSFGGSLVITASPDWRTWTEMAVNHDGCAEVLDFGENAGRV